MKVTVKTAQLQELADMVSRFVSKHSTLPILENIYIKGIDGGNAKLEIYMINCSLIKESEGDKISVTDIESGTYILKIKNGDKHAAYPIFINH